MLDSALGSSFWAAFGAGTLVALVRKAVLETALGSSFGAAFGAAFGAGTLVELVRKGCWKPRSDRHSEPRSGPVHPLHWSGRGAGNRARIVVLSRVRGRYTRCIGPEGVLSACAERLGDPMWTKSSAPVFGANERVDAKILMTMTRRPRVGGGIG